MRKIKLSSGAFAKIDDEDYEKIVNVGAWQENNMGYAYHSTSKGGKSVYIGFFQTPEEASKAYQKYWEKRNGIF